MKLKAKRKREKSIYPTNAGSYAGERQLWCAVLNQMIHDAIGRSTWNGSKGEIGKIQDEAIHYFESNCKSFRMVCDLAGFEPDAIRGRVLKALGKQHYGKETIKAS